jgi:hypothetical protein
VIVEDEMKSAKGKERWREFMMRYEKKIDMYNFGTILRISPKTEYEQDTTIFGKSPVLVLLFGWIEADGSSADAVSRDRVGEKSVEVE